MRAQVKALTSTRAVAAIMVVIHHFGQGIYPFTLSTNLFHCGDIAVSYFFVLSGFVLYISYVSTPVSYADYIKRRIGRIVPLYLFALLFFISVAVLFLGYAMHGNAVKEIILSALLLQAYVPSYPLVLNSPAWTISVEMFFYILFPFCLLLMKKNLRYFIILTAVLFLVAQYFSLKYYPARWSLPDNIVDTVFFNPVMHISQFLVGMAGGYIYLQLRPVALRYQWTPVVLFVAIVLLIAYRPANVSYEVGLIAPVFMLFIVSVAMRDPKWMNAGFFVFLGEISYGIYILQFPVFKLLESLNSRYVHLYPPFLFFSGLLILIMVAASTYFMIEKPLRNFINKLRLGERS